MTEVGLEPTEYGRGYNQALEDIEQWLDETVSEWQGLKIVSDNQALPLKDLLNEFARQFLYVRRTV